MVKNLLYISKRVTHYRQDFLKEFQKITDDDFRLNLSFDIYNRETIQKGDGAEEQYTDIKLITIGSVSREFYFILPQRNVLNYDFIMFAPELRNVSWLVITFLKYIGIYKGKIILFGHGENFSKTSNSIFGKFNSGLRVFLINKCDLFLGYTLSYLNLRNLNLSHHGSINNSSIRSRDIVSKNKLEKKLELLKHSAVFNLVYCGSLYKEKRIDILIKIMEILEVYKPNFFKLHIIGDGPDRNILDINANNNSVIHYGHLSGIKKRNIFSKSALFVNPGFIGLGLLDACAMGVPVLLSSAVNHSHEYEYFEDTAGFLISGKSANDFASSIIKISEDRLTLESKSFKAISLASKYTIENMAYRFKQKLFEI